MTGDERHRRTFFSPRDGRHPPRAQHDSHRASRRGLLHRWRIGAGPRSWQAGARRHVTAAWRGLARLARQRWMRRTLWAAGAAAALVLVSFGALWWRLSQGPIELDVVTPWLVAAIEDNFGGKHTVTVGGTQIERDENGGTSLRLRDIVVRDADGTVVASAPKAEVGLSGFSLLRGQMRAQSLNLVGAEMSVRIESDGRVTVFAGADKRPIPRRRRRSARGLPILPACSRGSTGSVRPVSTVTICASSVSRTAISASTTGATASIGPSIGSMPACGGPSGAASYSVSNPTIRGGPGS